ncbi:MAG: DMT family transporter [Rhodospirillales bacterium]|nr:DMT family transporter [Rhodospirillales bacterium]
MLAATLLAAIMNSAARHVSQTVHPFELVFFRNLFAFAFVIPMLWRVGFFALRTQRPWMHVGRASLNVVNMMVWFTAVSLAPLAEVVALGFTAPIFATILGVLILKEMVGMRRWSAIIAGFAGALIILQPGFDTVQLGHGLVLVASVMWAGVLLMIKSLSRTESSIAIVAYMSILMTPMSLIPALFVWEWPTWTELAWLVLIGFCGGAGQYLLSQAFHEADISVVMPFDFGKLVWVALIAFIAFGEIPTWTTWAGGAIIFASGVYIARREAMKNRERRG